MIQLSLANLGAYSGQIIIVVSLAAAAARLLDIPFPRVRLAYWRAVVIVCLALPLAALVQPSLPEFSSFPQVSVAPGQSPLQQSPMDLGGLSSPGDARAPGLPLSMYISMLVLAGIVGRGLWLSLGLGRLRSLRRNSSPFLLDPEMESLRAEIAPHADIRCHSDARQPATFGLRRPVILLPDSIAGTPPAARFAIVCHELMHVQRRDWAWTVGEEIVRTLFWFHPAMHYAISRGQTTREEVVDADVIARTGARQEYMRALVAFADHSVLAPAPSFVARHHLQTRLRRITEEVHMSRPRLRVAVSMLAGILVVAVALAAAGLRYEVAAQQPVQAGPASAVQFTVPVARAIVRLDRPVYPAEAWRAGIGAVISTTIRIDPNGMVTAERPPNWQIVVTDSSPADVVQNFWARRGWQDFVDSVTDAFSQWQYVPADAPVTVPVQVTFLGARLPVQISPGAGGGRSLTYTSTRGGNTVTFQSGAPGATPTGAVRVGGNIRPPARIVHVDPVYPEAARAARVQGVVIIELVIGADGSVVQAQVLRSIPLLDQAAIDAVSQWRFEPTYLNGQPQAVVMTVTVNFSLQDPA